MNFQAGPISSGQVISTAPLRDRWITGIALMLESVAQIEDSPEKRVVLERFFNWVEQSAREFLPESKTERSGRISLDEWSRSVNAALTHFEQLHEQYPDLALRASGLKTDIEAQAKSPEVKVMFQDARAPLKTRVSQGCRNLIKKMADLGSLLRSKS